MKDRKVVRCVANPQNTCDRGRASLYQNAFVAGRYRSGQTGRTVNPLAYAFAGSNPALPNFQPTIVLLPARFLPASLRAGRSAPSRFRLALASTRTF